MKYILSPKFEFPKRIVKIIKKELKVSDLRNINGLYFYNSKTVYVNLNSYEFSECTTENSIIKTFEKVVTHETLHHCIYNLTHQITNPTEEKFVELMAGQR